MKTQPPYALLTAGSLGEAKRSLSTLRSLTRIALGLSLSGILAFGLSACGGGSDSEKAPEDEVNVLDLQEQTEELLEEARAADMEKVAPDDFSRAEKQIEKAGALLDEGEQEDARKQLRLATARLKSYISGRERVKEAVAAAAPLRKEVEAIRKKADATTAKTTAAMDYEEAVKALADATKALERAADERDVRGAERLLESAKTSFARAMEIAKENETYRQRAMTEKEAMGNWKQKAKERGAEEKAAQDWIYAAQKEREADDLLGRGEFQNAVDAYMEAARLFTSAIEAVQTKEDQERMLAEAAAAERAILEGTQAVPGTEGMEPPEEGAATAEPEGISLDPNPDPQAVPEGLPPTEPGATTPLVSSVTVFDGYDPVNYPQEVTAEDEAFLETNFKKLCPSGQIEYDPMTGGVRLDYTVGEDCQKDHIKLTGNTIIEFKSAFQPTPMRGMDRDDRRKQTPFSFAGNTQGFVYFPVPFKYYVRIDFDMQVLTMDATGTFTVAPMLDPRRRAAYAIQWLSLGILQSGAPKVAAPKVAPYNKVADSWFDKTRPVPMMIEYKMPDPDEGGDATDSGRISVTYDVGGKDVTNAIGSKRYTSGHVGFLWSRTKFEVKNLTITGILDKKAAVELLRSKAGSGQRR